MEQYTRLNLRERCTIATFIDINAKVSVIAQKTGRHRSTIYRELKRNIIGERYLPGKANALAKQRHPHPPNKIDTQPDLNQFLFNGLAKGWSPEQISGRMKKEKTKYYACHESIYRYIYKNKKSSLYKLLPRQKPKRYPHFVRKKHHKTLLLYRNICKRPKEVNLRDTFGHWEGDTINFVRNQRSCVTTLVERKSRFLLLHKNESKKSLPVIDKITNTIKSFPKKMWQSLTLDQGSEFMSFLFLERKTKCNIFFCDPSSPWQRASNENMNGRLRRFLPRNLQIDELEQKELDIIAMKANGTPRKCLGYQTPREVVIQHYSHVCRIGL